MKPVYERDLFGTHRLTGFQLRCKAVLKEAPASLIDRLMETHHYSHKTPVNRALSYGVFQGTTLVGGMQLGYGIRPFLKHTVAQQIIPGNYYEFDRMWLSDCLPRNSESECIAGLVAMVKSCYKPIRWLISYADEGVGNTGTIYRASGFFYLGWVLGDMYVLPSGERVHPVTMWHRHKTRAWDILQVLYPDIKRLRAKQHRFLLPLYTKERKLCGASLKSETPGQLEGEGQFLGSAPITL